MGTPNNQLKGIEARPYRMGREWIGQTNVQFLKVGDLVQVVPKSDGKDPWQGKVTEVVSQNEHGIFFRYDKLENNEQVQRPASSNGQPASNGHAADNAQNNNQQSQANGNGNSRSANQAMGTQLCTSCKPVVEQMKRELNALISKYTG